MSLKLKLRQLLTFFKMILLFFSRQLLDFVKKIPPHLWRQFKEINKFKALGTFLCVFGSFYAFSFYVRMEDKKDFDHWKPRIWIPHTDSLHIELKNQNEEPIWFIGFDTSGNIIDSAPDKYQPLFKSSSNEAAKFIIRLRDIPRKPLVSWWTDGNLNKYRIGIEYVNGHYKPILPVAKRTDSAQSLYGYAPGVLGSDPPNTRTPWVWLRVKVASLIRSTAGDEWYKKDIVVPEDSTLYPFK